MRPKEIREMTDDELHEREEDLAKELLNLRHQAATQQLENPRRIRTVKRIVARIKTILHERELGKR
jgi:large subunit ribosomal protein L29